MAVLTLSTLFKGNPPASDHQPDQDDAVDTFESLFGQSQWTTATLEASTLTYSQVTVGDYIRINDNFVYEVAASDAAAADYDIETAGDPPTAGVKLKALPINGEYHVEQFGATSAGFNLGTLGANNDATLAASNAAAFQKAVDAAEARGVGTVRCTGLGYLLTHVEVPVGVTLKGNSFPNDGVSNSKAPFTTLYQLASYPATENGAVTASTDIDLIRFNRDPAQGNNNQWGGGLDSLHLARNESAITGTRLLGIYGGAKYVFRDLRLKGGDEQLVIDGTQDSDFYSINCGGGNYGCIIYNDELSGQADTLRFFGLWIESSNTRPLMVKGGSSSNLSNNIYFYGLKAETTSTSGTENILLEDVENVVIAGGHASISEAANPTAPFDYIRIRGTARGVYAPGFKVRNNNEDDAINSFVKFEAESGDQIFSIKMDFNGALNGTPNLGALVDYGDTADGFVTPQATWLDFTGVNGLSGETTASGTVTVARNNVIVHDGVQYGEVVKAPHPLRGNSRVTALTDEAETHQLEDAVTGSNAQLFFNNNRYAQITTTGRFQSENFEATGPIRLDQQTVAQLQNETNYDPTVYDGAIVFVSNAASADLSIAVASGGDWVYLTSGAAVTA